MSGAVYRRLYHLEVGKEYNIRFVLQTDGLSEIDSVEMVLLRSSLFDIGFLDPDTNIFVSHMHDTLEMNFVAKESEMIFAISASRETMSPYHFYVDEYSMRQKWVTKITCPPGNFHYAHDNYRFGFNGMEVDNHIYGKGGLYVTEFRLNDPRLGGRWWSPDKIVKPWESPYAGYSNNPVFYSDPSGLDPEEPNATDNDGIDNSKLEDGATWGDYTYDKESDTWGLKTLEVVHNAPKHHLSYVDMSGMFDGWGNRGNPNGSNPERYGYTAEETQRLSTYAVVGVFTVASLGSGGIGANFASWAWGTRLSSAGLDLGLQVGMNGWRDVNATSLVTSFILFRPNWQSVLLGNTLSTAVQWSKERGIRSIFSTGEQQVGLSQIAIGGGLSVGFNHLSRYIQFKQLHYARKQFHTARVLQNGYLVSSSSGIGLASFDEVSQRITNAHQWGIIIRNSTQVTEIGIGTLNNYTQDKVK